MFQFEIKLSFSFGFISLLLLFSEIVSTHYISFLIVYALNERASQI